MNESNLIAAASRPRGLIGHVVALETIVNTRTTGIAAALLWMAGLVAAVALDATDVKRSGHAPAHEQQAGVFSGEFVNGLPVYRFPTVTVTADRKAELAKNEGEAAVARTRAMRAKSPSSLLDLPTHGT
jgi:hypothetical protein